MMILGIITGIRESTDLILSCCFLVLLDQIQPLTSRSSAIIKCIINKKISMLFRMIFVYPVNYRCPGILVLLETIDSEFCIDRSYPIILNRYQKRFVNNRFNTDRKSVV